MHLPRMDSVSVKTADTSALLGLSCMQLSCERDIAASLMVWR